MYLAESRKWTIGLIVETVITVIFIILLGNYSSKLRNEYLQGKTMNFISAFNIIGDPGYIEYFFWSIVFICLLIAVGFIAFRKGLKLNNEADNYYRWLLILGYPIVNLILLIALLIVFYSPILLATITGLVVLGIVVLAFDSGQY